MSFSGANLRPGEIAFKLHEIVNRFLIVIFPSSMVNVKDALVGLDNVLSEYLAYRFIYVGTD